VHGCETDHIFLSRAEVVTARRYTFTVWCFFEDRGKFTFMSTCEEMPRVL